MFGGCWEFMANERFRIIRKSILVGTLIPVLLLGYLSFKETERGVTFMNSPTKRGQIYRWADSLVSVNPERLTVQELNTFLEKIVPDYARSLEGRSIENWSDFEVDYLTKRYYEFCKNQGR